MSSAIEIIQDKIVKKEIHFQEQFYYSKDRKTIMGEVAFSEILFLDYRDTEAGSNPREYTGLVKTNINIIKSLLKDPYNMFRFLHSGIIASLVNPVVKNDIIEYDDCCLTNGNQTRFIILIIVFMKLLFNTNSLRNIKQIDITNYIKNVLLKSGQSNNILSFIKPGKINQIVNFLKSNTKYNKFFDSMKLEDFLNSKIRIQLNIVNAIVDELDVELDTYTAGTLIAEANNDTQKVKADDIFGNKYKGELEKSIFKEFIKYFKNKVEIEFRFGEIAGTIDKVHILALLRPVIATGVLTKETNIYNFTNQRDPIYKLFEKLLKKQNNKNIIELVSKLIVLLYDIRENYVKRILAKHKRVLTRKYKGKAILGGLEGTIISDDLNKLKDNDSELERFIKRQINYNVEHILPVLIYNIRQIIILDSSTDKLKLDIDEEKLDEFLTNLVEVIYENYVEKKLGGLPSSLTTLVRSKSFYEMGSESYKAFIRQYKINENNFILSNRFIV